MERAVIIDVEPGPAARDQERALLAQAATFGAAQPTIAVPVRPGIMISLRPLRTSDVAAVVVTCQDPTTVAWTVVPDQYTQAEGHAFVTEFAPGRWASGQGAIFAIADPDDRYAGSISLALTGPTIGDVGYVVAPGCRGLGYASAALGALCDWAFEAFGLHRIEWRAYLGNHGSRRVAENAGFTMEGVGRGVCVQRGRYRDAWVGARLRTDPRRPANRPQPMTEETK